MIQIVVSKQDLTSEWYFNRTWESSSNGQCLWRSTPSVINVFCHSVVRLNGDVATTTTVQEFGIHLPINASALDKHLPTTELTCANFIIFHNCTDTVISLVGVFLWLSLA